MQGGALTSLHENPEIREEKMLGGPDKGEKKGVKLWQGKERGLVRSKD